MAIHFVRNDVLTVNRPQLSIIGCLKQSGRERVFALPAIQPLRDREPANRDPTGSRIGLRIERDLLALLQGSDTRALKRGGVHEYISAAIVRLNEAETFVAVVEFHCAICHDNVPSLTVCVWDRAHGFAASSQLLEFGERLKRAPRQCKA